MTATQHRPTPYFDTAAVLAHGYTAAVTTLTDALRNGLDTTIDPPRSSVPTAEGNRLMLMPSVAWGVGVKVIANAPGNPALGLPVGIGRYLLFDPDTMQVTAEFDGAALTRLRTPATSYAGVLPALTRWKHPRVVVFGLGPQGVGHLDALCDLAEHHDAIGHPKFATFVSRHPVGDRLPTYEQFAVHEVAAGSEAAARSLHSADIVVAATNAATPLFDSDLLSDEAVVMSVGSHLPGLVEVDTALARRATVVVEDLAIASEENGIAMAALADGSIATDELVTLTDVANGAAEHRFASGPVLFTGSGMAWQDLVVARSIADAADSAASLSHDAGAYTTP